MAKYRIPTRSRRVGTQIGGSVRKHTFGQTKEPHEPDQGKARDPDEERGSIPLPPSTYMILLQKSLQK
jgi:hypothetical protein